MNGYPPPPPRPTVATIFPSTPPPRPSSINERPRIFTSSDVEESCDKPRRTIVLRWDAIVTVIVTLAVGIVLGMGVQWQLSTNADPWHGVPACTDQIADAGGICHGEPR